MKYYIIFISVSKPETPKQDGAAVDDEVTKGLNDSDLSPKTRPRSTSDKFNRPPSKKVVDVYKQVYFIKTNPKIIFSSSIKILFLFRLHLTGPWDR